MINRSSCHGYIRQDTRYIAFCCAFIIIQNIYNNQPSNSMRANLNAYIRYIYIWKIHIYCILFGFKQHVTINHNNSCKARTVLGRTNAFTINDDGRLTPQLCFRRMNEKWRNLQLNRENLYRLYVYVPIFQRVKNMYKLISRIETKTCYDDG